ncbi:hypothetical protein OIDMADRAFT_62365 [Oidiodendron maius Zn]|uniref:Uncharacterized protein n=1 Tax=Oidiodendron maius (strain Zn) TaxID=913774 RepID=A0A0C3C1H0_OIDMZ|nr:hypothetical protein OIDMADRAFT_62365 [Oidiodendron maius Zn]
MVAFTTASAVTIVAFCAIIEPTLAGPVAAAARVAGSVASVADAVGGKKGHKRDASPETQIDVLFEPCFESSRQNPPTVKYDVEKKEGDILHLDNLCMDAFRKYNKMFDSSDLGHATVKEISPNAVHVSDIPSKFLEDLERNFGRKGNSGGAHSTAGPAAQPVN